MDEAQVLATIKQWIEGWPKDEYDVFRWRLIWPDELSDQERTVVDLVREMRDPETPLLQPHMIYEFLQQRARECGLAMVNGDATVSKVPTGLVAWVLLVAGDVFPPPPKRTGRPFTAGALRNLKILSVEHYLREELGFTREKALQLIGSAIDRDRDTVVTALRNAKKTSRTSIGSTITGALHLKIRGYHLGPFGELLGLEDPV